MKFTEKFNECLKYSHLKQSEIANYCKTTRQNITNFKSGRTYPSIETLYLLCKCLDVSADYLLGLDEDNYTEKHSSKYHIGTLNNNGGDIDMK